MRSKLPIVAIALAVLLGLGLGPTTKTADAQTVYYTGGYYQAHAVQVPGYYYPAVNYCYVPGYYRTYWTWVPTCPVVLAPCVVPTPCVVPAPCRVIVCSTCCCRPCCCAPRCCARCVPAVTCGCSMVVTAPPPTITCCSTGVIVR